MSQKGWVTAPLLLALVLAAGCQDDKVDPSAAEFEKQRKAVLARQAPAAAVEEVEEAPATAPERLYAYDRSGKRDPFRSFVLEKIKELEVSAKGPLEQFELSQLRVLGVVWETDEARALVSDPSGQGYIVKEGDPIGKNDGFVLEIDDNLVLVQETYEDYLGDQTTKNIEMRVRQSQGG